MTRTRQPIAAIDPVCLECGKMAVHGWGIDVWPEKRHLKDVPVYRCECGAWSFCWRGTDTTLGRPAHGPHHALCGRAQNAIDSLVAAKIRQDGGGKEKNKLLCATWLAEKIGVEVGSMHVHHLTKEQVREVVRICEPLSARIQERELRARHSAL